MRDINRWIVQRSRPGKRSDNRSAFFMRFQDWGAVDDRRLTTDRRFKLKEWIGVEGCFYFLYWPSVFSQLSAGISFPDILPGIRAKSAINVVSADKRSV